MLQPQSVVHRAGGFDEIEPEAWDELVARSDFPSVFQSYGWLKSWWDTFREPSWELVLLIAMDGPRLVGLAPLYSAPYGGPDHRRCVRFVGYEHSDYSTVIVDRNRLDVLDWFLDGISRLTAVYGCVELADVPARSACGAKLLEKSRAFGGAVDLLETTVCPRLTLDGQRLEAVLKKESLRRHTQKLQKLGRVTVEHLSDPAAIAPLLDGFFQQHVERWRMTRYPSLFLKEQNREFYRRFVEALAPGGHVVFTVVRLNDRPVACHLGFRSGGEFYWYKPTFDVCLAQVSPGEVLLRELFVMAGQGGYTAFDFLRGDEAFKGRFASESPVNHTFAIRRSWAERALRRTARHARRAVRRMLVPRALDPVLAGVALDHPEAGAAARVARAGVRLARDLARRGASWVYARRGVSVYEATPLTGAAERGHASARVIEADLGTLLKSAQFTSEGDRRTILQAATARFRTGDKCYLVLEGERVAGFGWVATRPEFMVTEVGLPLPFGPSEFVLYDFVVFPQWRGRGLYPALLRGIRALNADKTLWIFAEHWNRASVKGIVAAGFTFAFTMERTKVLGRTIRLLQAPAAAASTGHA